MKADELRRKFLEFFKSKNHQIVESDSLLPKDDPTLLFTGAGMNQFKQQFLGQNITFKRAASCQKCLRTQDTEKVGKTQGHHTFFEMLGNFSFGDYFKDEAIAWSWEFLTDTLLIKPQRLWASVYEEDDEAYDTWKDKINIPKDRIIKLGDKENFWPQEVRKNGPNGPCGPCSEIFFDWGKDVGCKKPDCNPACDCGRFVEVWNLVFTQFDRKEGGTLEPLPKKNIDTGMGLERLAAVMQEVKTNFETDLFMPIIDAIKSLGTKEPRGSAFAKASADRQGVSYEMNAIADHIRAITFAISDGIIPSNEERGYVIRSLIRKAYLAGKSLGLEKAFLYKLVPTVASVMKEAYPELTEKRENISQIVKAEEDRFLNTLTSGMNILEQVADDLKKINKTTIRGEVAFKLFDTHGIPLELIKQSAKEKGLSVDEEGFFELMEAQRQRSRAKSQIEANIFAKQQAYKPSEFIGYRQYAADAKIIDILKDGKTQQKTSEGEVVDIILDKSVFYGESGGQVGDTGTLEAKDARAQVLDTKKIDNAIVLKTKILKGALHIDESVKETVDYERRLAIARNHTATHLLQSALRQVLGQHVQQQGSLVAPDRLRFDFTHFKDLSEQQLKRIEELVNERIISDEKVFVENLSQQEAKKKGALAFFKEKYDDTVRMVSVKDYSKELCGGTHVEHIGQIGLFKIINESSIASGIRRIEAITGETAFKKLKEDQQMLKTISNTLELKEPKELPERIEKLLKKVKELDKLLKLQRRKIFQLQINQIIKNAQDFKGSRIIIHRQDGLSNAQDLRELADLIKKNLGSCIVILASWDGQRSFVLVAVTEDLVKKGLDAAGLAKKIADLADSKGGGSSTLAQLGSKDKRLVDVAVSEGLMIIKNAFGGI